MDGRKRMTLLKALLSDIWNMALWIGANTGFLFENLKWWLWDSRRSR